MADEIKRIKIKCDLYWAQLHKVNDMSGKYQVNLCNLSDAACSALEEMGIEVRVGEGKKEEMGRYITCKSNNPYKAFNEDGEEIESLVGNGSKAKAMVSSYSWTYKNKKGISPSLGKLVVTSLVAYAAEGMGDDDDIL